MFTTIDKAIAAMIGGLGSFLMLKFGIDLSLSADTINMISVGVSTFLTWLVPNKTA